MRLNRFQMTILGAGLLACAANAAITISLVDDGSGYDEASMSGFRSTGVAKSFDIDDDDIYGTAGTFFFGQGGDANVNSQPFSRHTDNLPAWVNGVAQGAHFGSVAEYITYSPIDDPTLTPTNDVADWPRSAIGLATLGGAGSWSEIMTFSVSGAPTAFRLGIMAGNEANTDGRWDPTGLRLSVDGGTAVEVTDLPIVNGTVGMVFFNITTDGSAGTFSVEGQQRKSTQGPSIAGLTFDVSTNGVFPTAPGIEYFVVAHTETEGLGKAAWSVSNAVSVTVLDAADQPVAGVSGLQGTVDITYVSGDTFTLVAESSNGVQRTESKAIVTTTGQDELVTFTFSDSPLTNPTNSASRTRRDPSDVIKVGDTWHVWYSKAAEGVTSGYDASVWHATSTNAGNSWIEQGESIPRGSNTNDWDYTSTFTPNILLHDGTYYLYFTAIGNGSLSKIGVATSSSPYGPWVKYSGNPILTDTDDSEKFDSYLVDDSCLAVRDGNVWLYYKGRADGLSSSQTKMGVAVATNGVGPFIRQNGGDPVQLGGHEVQIWADENQGIYSMVNGVGPATLTHTIQYAPDGINFSKYCDISSNEPGAPGMFRRELIDPSLGCVPEWGVYGTRSIGRYEIDFSYPGERVMELDPGSITEGNRVGDSVGTLSVTDGTNY
uniref:family 43 glycosylhydrolase n=1 Tax=Pontiella sp. TaxID=2837462 RepID=UPI003568A645